MKVVGEPDEGKPHVRFDVAGDENQDMVMVLRHSQKKWGVNRLPSPKPQASSLDPTSGQAGFFAIYRHFSGFEFSLFSNIFPARPRPPLTRTVETVGKVG